MFCVNPLFITHAEQSLVRASFHLSPVISEHTHVIGHSRLNDSKSYNAGK